MKTINDSVPPANLVVVTRQFNCHLIDQPKLNKLTGEQPQGPIGIPRGWRSQSHRNELSFLFAIQQLIGRWVWSFNSIEDDLKALFNQALANLLYGSDLTVKGICYLLVCPVRSIGIRF